MSDTVRLVRHPAAKATESMFGYILRLAQENGYSSWSPVLSLAGMPKETLGRLDLSIRQLAGISNRSELELESIRYLSPGMEKDERCLLGNPIDASHSRLHAPAICPECLIENGFIEAYFDLALMTGCATHKMVLLYNCPECSQPLRWSRPGLLKCHCGADLVKPNRAAISPHEVDLLDVLRRKVLGLSTAASGYTSGVPACDLLKMSLRRLIRFTNKLGWTRHTRRKGETDFEMNQHLLRHAANILATHCFYYDKGGRARLHR